MNRQRRCTGEPWRTVVRSGRCGPEDDLVLRTIEVVAPALHGLAKPGERFTEEGEFGAALGALAGVLFNERCGSANETFGNL